MNSTTTHTVTATTSPVSLKTALLLDATVTGANALAYVAGAAVLDSLLGPSPSHFVAIGAFLAVCADDPRGHRHAPADPARLGDVRRRGQRRLGRRVGRRRGARLVRPHHDRQVWTILQAALVAAFAALQLTALRRTP